VAQRKGKQIIT